MTQIVKPVLLIILDGWGDAPASPSNAISQAQKPFFDDLCRDHPHGLIDGSGPAVGLPQGIMGNSEVGHMNLGAGRIVFSGLSQIYQAIESKSLLKNPTLLNLMHQVRDKNQTLHIMGLLSDGAVHSHEDHLYALLRMAKSEGLSRVVVHGFTDGRDTDPQSGRASVERLLEILHNEQLGMLGSLSGRFYAMDRDQRWDRIHRTYKIMVDDSFTTLHPVDYIQQSYDQGVTDEFLEPVSLGLDAKVQPGDGLLFFNFRADRARQMTQVWTDRDFKEFDRGPNFEPCMMVTMMPYAERQSVPAAFFPEYPSQTLGEIVAQNGVPQLRLAETEKYAHVTFFFNGGRDVVFDQEERILVCSPKDVKTYDQKPEMSAPEVTARLLEALALDKYGLIVCNYANADMVGHTAQPQAVVKAIETLDACLAQVVPLALQHNYRVLITADHGNAECLQDQKGRAMTAHTTNLVPFIAIDPTGQIQNIRTGGRLCDVAPTILQLMGLDQPVEMTGHSLVNLS